MTGIIFLFCLLLAVGGFAFYELKHIRRRVQTGRRAQNELEEIKTYNKNLLDLLDWLHQVDIASVLEERIPGDIVLFGYNAIARSLIAGMTRSGRTVQWVIENNKIIRQQANHSAQTVELISNEGARARLTADAHVVVCVFHNRAYKVREELSKILPEAVKVTLLREIISEERREKNSSVKNRSK